MRPAKINSNCLLLMPLQEGSGLSVGARVGSSGSLGNATWIDGVVGKAVRLAGTGQLTTPAISIPVSCTFRILLKVEDWSTKRAIWNQFKYGYYVEGSGISIDATNLYAGSTNSYDGGSDDMIYLQALAPHGLTLNQWFMLHVTYSSSGYAKIYVNGAFKGQGLISGDFGPGYYDNGSIPGNFGGSGLSVSAFVGTFSHAAIFAREFTAQEVAVDYFGKGEIF